MLKVKGWTWGISVAPQSQDPESFPCQILPQDVAPCSGREGSCRRAQPRAVMVPVDTGWQEGWHPGGTQAGESGEVWNLLCFLLLKCVIFWKDEEVSALSSSEKAFFLLPGPSCVSVAVGERSGTEPTLLVS